MKRARIARILRLSASTSCLAVSTVIAVAWLRNFWWADVAWAPLPGDVQLAMASAHGQVEFGISYAANRWTTYSNRQTAFWGWQTYTASCNRVLDVLVPWKTVIRYRFARSGDISVVLPHWLLVLVTLLVAAVPWIRWSRRFTIRTLLVITTLVAVVLALVVTAGE